MFHFVVRVRPCGTGRAEQSRTPERLVFRFYLPIPIQAEP